MTDPYRDGENRVDRFRTGLGRVSSMTEMITATLFIVIGVGALIAASFFGEPLAALIGAIAIVIGVVRLVLQRVRSR